MRTPCLLLLEQKPYNQGASVMDFLSRTTWGLTLAFALVSPAIFGAPPNLKPSDSRADTDLPLLRTATEKPKVINGIATFVNVREQGLAYASDHETILVQRGGGGGFVGKQGMGGYAGPNPALLGLPIHESLSLWNLKTKKKIKELSDCHAFVTSPRGETAALLISVKNQLKLRLVKIQNWQTLWEAEVSRLADIASVSGVRLTPDSLMMMSFAFSPDGQEIAFQYDRRVAFVNAQTGQRISTRDTQFAHLVGYLADGKSILSRKGAVPGEEPPLAIWETKEGNMIQHLGDQNMNRAVLSPKGNLVATCIRPHGQFFFGNPLDRKVERVAFNTHKIEIWDGSTGKRIAVCDTQNEENIAIADLAPLKGKVGMIGGIMDVAFSPDGRVLASASSLGEKGLIQLWEARTGKELAKIRINFNPQAVAFSLDGQSLAAAGGLGNFDLRVWSVSEYKIHSMDK